MSCVLLLRNKLQEMLDMKAIRGKMMKVQLNSMIKEDIKKCIFAQTTKIGTGKLFQELIASVVYH